MLKFETANEYTGYKKSSAESSWGNEAFIASYNNSGKSYKYANFEVWFYMLEFSSFPEEIFYMYVYIYMFICMFIFICFIFGNSGWWRNFKSYKEESLQWQWPLLTVLKIKIHMQSLSAWLNFSNAVLKIRIKFHFFFLFFLIINFLTGMEKSKSLEWFLQKLIRHSLTQKPQHLLFCRQCILKSTI